MKIAIIGTHGSGKTTLSYQLAAYYKGLGKSVKIIQEVARSCPFPINEKMTSQAALWIYLEHCKKELEASKFNIIIGDRSMYDSFVYAEYFDITNDLVKKYSKIAFDELENYHKIIFVRPDLAIHKDGMRSVDEEFQKSIDEIFEKKLVNKDVVEIKSSTIFKEKLEWMQSYL